MLYVLVCTCDMTIWWIAIGSMQHLEMTFDLLIILFNEIPVLYVCASICISWNTQEHVVILLNCEKLKCRLLRVCAHSWSFVIWAIGANGVDAIFSFHTGRLHQSCPDVKLDFFRNHKMQTNVKRKRYQYQDETSQCTMEPRKTLINWFWYFACMWPAVGHALVCTVPTRVKQLVDCGRSLFMHADFCIRWRSVRT